MPDDRAVFTTGQVARICKVAPRTVVKWFDSGQLPGYRIPMSQDRRVTRESLLAFLRRFNMPIPISLSGRAVVLAIGCDRVFVDHLTAALGDGVNVVLSDSLFDAGKLALDASAVIVDCCVGRDEAVSVARRLSGEINKLCVLTVVLAGEDCGAAEARSLWKHDGGYFDSVHTKPANPVVIAEEIKAAMRPGKAGSVLVGAAPAAPMKAVTAKAATKVTTPGDKGGAPKTNPHARQRSPRRRAVAKAGR